MTAYGDWLGRRALLSPGQVAIWDLSDASAGLTYAQWNRAVNQTAWFLRERGVGRGDRVAVLAHNERAVLDLWFACGKLGAVFHALNWRSSASELRAIVSNTEPRVLVHGAALSAHAREFGERFPKMGLVPLDPNAALPGEVPLSARSAQPQTAPPEVTLGPDDPWALCSTGGSTGTPKAAVLTHGSVTANAVNTVVSWGLGPGDVALLNAPLFHTGGLNVFTSPLVFAGGASLLCGSFDVDQVFDLVEAGRVTVFFGVPTMFLLLQQHPRWRTATFPRVRYVMSGGAPCPPEVFQRFWDKGVEFKTGYGLTEAGPNNFWLPAEQVKRKPGSVGVPLMQVEAQLRNAEDGPCAPNEVGELLLRGPHVAAGYWRQPEETARVFGSGWLRTGDLALRDEEGFYFIKGRKKDMLISGGEHVYPSEVEAALSSHPSVAEVAVIGVADPKWGEVPRGIVVLAAGCEANPDALTRHCQALLARYKAPHSFVFVPSLPRTGTGKVDRTLLAKQFGS